MLLRAGIVEVIHSSHPSGRVRFGTFISLIALLSFHLSGTVGLRAEELKPVVAQRSDPSNSVVSPGTARRLVARPILPPPPEGVAEFSLSELLVPAKNVTGVDYSPRARQLDGKMVRVNGYMVSQSTPIPWVILLSPVPQSAHEREFFLCDDLPVSTIHVFLPKNSQPLFPFHPEMMAITGRLELGGRSEADERTSLARVFVTPGHRDSIQSVTNLIQVPVTELGAAQPDPTHSVPSNTLSKP